MHDCPRCKVPLHGHEQFCPACGAKQIVRPEYRDIQVPKAPPVNIVPFLVAFAIIVVIGVFAAQGSWVGQLLTHGEQKQDPLDALTLDQARQLIESKISQGLTAIGAPVKISYSYAGAKVDKLLAKPLEMTIDTSLKDPNQHKAVVDPIKQYMDKARIPTLTMHDARSRATWTYSCTLSAPAADGAADGTADGSPAPDGAADGAANGAANGSPATDGSAQQ